MKISCPSSQRASPMSEILEFPPSRRRFGPAAGSQCGPADGRRCGPGLRRPAARRRVRQAAADHRLRPVAQRRSSVCAPRRSDRRSHRPPSCGGDAAARHRRSCGARARPTSSSSRCRRRSTTRTSPTSAPLGRRQRDGRPPHEAAARSSSTSRPSIPAPPRKSACRSWRSDSGMHWKHDFYVGYSPERINPGDQEHTLHADPEGGLGRRRGDARERRRSSTAAW